MTMKKMIPLNTSKDESTETMVGGKGRHRMRDNVRIQSIYPVPLQSAAIFCHRNSFFNSPGGGFMDIECVLCVLYQLPCSLDAHMSAPCSRVLSRHTYTCMYMRVCVRERERDRDRDRTTGSIWRCKNGKYLRKAKLLPFGLL